MEAPGEFSRFVRYGALAGIVLLAVVVRIPGMDNRLLPDEGYTWLVASAPSAGSFLHRLAIYENTPPLYYLLLTALPLNDEPWVRLPAMIAGVAAVPVLYAIARPRLGTRVALLSALGLAIAPYAVAISNFGRGFALADIALLIAVWAAVRLAEGGSRRWWLLYAFGAALAIYSEYDAITTLAPLILALVILMPPPRWRTAALGAAPALAFIPWIHEYIRSANDLNVTKVGGGYVRVTPNVVRNQLVTLFYGETGKSGGGALRWLALIVVIVAIALCARVLLRQGERVRPLFVVVGFAGLGTLLLHALSPVVGVGIFNVNYMTFVLPMGVVVLAAGVAAIPFRVAVPVAAIALVLAGVGLTYKRLHDDHEPDPHTIAELLHRGHVRTVLTNSAVIMYYLRDLDPILDRPFNLGVDREFDCAGCARPLAVVDDANVGNGPRPGPGPRVAVGHYVVRFVPDSVG